MNKAFRAACAGLKDSQMSKVAYEIIASRIFEAAKRGERDPTRLCKAALTDISDEHEAEQS
jgi:hypothetical protein